MLQNAYLLAKIGFDTAENGPHRFQKSAEWDTAAPQTAGWGSEVTWLRTLWRAEGLPGIQYPEDHSCRRCRNCRGWPARKLNHGVLKKPKTTPSVRLL